VFLLKYKFLYCLVARLAVETKSEWKNRPNYIQNIDLSPKLQNIADVLVRLFFCSTRVLTFAIASSGVHTRRAELIVQQQKTKQNAKSA